VSRLSFTACVLALSPVVAVAANPADDSPAGYKPARPDVKPAMFLTPTQAPGSYPPVVYSDMPPGYQYYGAKLRWQLWWDEHNCAPDGCPKPIGCGNGWTEFKYVFGSCRQFFGTSESTVGHGYHTTDRPK
jgi:hypothetical protein